jgi:CRISPR-associated protein Cas5h
MADCLVFDILGPLACFKTFFTTSSPLTFDFPPKTALEGMIGAIIGLDFDAKYGLFEGSVGIKILSGGAKMYTGVNWIDTKARGSVKLMADVPMNVPMLESLGLSATPQVAAFLGMTWKDKHAHTQVNLELLKDPRFRIYYPDSSPHYAELRDNIEQHHAVFTPFLGAATFLADFKLVDVASVTEEFSDGDEYVPIDSIIPVPSGETGPELDMKEVSPLMARVPRTMLPGRDVTEYTTVIYALNGGRVPAKVPAFHHVKGNEVDDNVIFF